MTLTEDALRHALWSGSHGLVLTLDELLRDLVVRLDHTSDPRPERVAQARARLAAGVRPSAAAVAAGIVEEVAGTRS